MTHHLLVHGFWGGEQSERAGSSRSVAGKKDVVRPGASGKCRRRRDVRFGNEPKLHAPAVATRRGRFPITPDHVDDLLKSERFRVREVL